VTTVGPETIRMAPSMMAACIDGFTSLAVLAGAIGVGLGFPLADPIVGLLIALTIMRIVWQSAKSVLSRAIDGVDPEVVDEIREALAHTPGVVYHERPAPSASEMDPEVVDEIREALAHTPGVVYVTETRMRWLGHRMLAEVNVAAPSGLSVEDGHAVAVEVRHQLRHRLQYLSDATGRKRDGGT
jgi:divalent metal cation (Fe/Co/Zn/Cd) transporter